MNAFCRIDYRLYSRIQSILALCLFICIAVTYNAIACQTTKTWVLSNPAKIRIDEVFEALFPDYLVTYDAGTGLLSVTGCAQHMEPIEKLVEACENKNGDAWAKELERQLWNSQYASGAFKNPVYEFTIRRPSSQQWQLAGVSVTASSFLKAAKGTGVFHMELLRDKTRLTFDVFDVEGSSTAEDVLTKLPAPSQSVLDAKWTQSVKEDMGRRVGGVMASNATSYHLRQMWITSGGSLVREAVVVAQPTKDKDATRIYLFYQVVHEKDYPMQRNWLLEVAEGLQIPEIPPRPLAPNAASLIASTNANGTSDDLKPMSNILRDIQQSKSPPIRKANMLLAQGDYTGAEKAYLAIQLNSTGNIRQELSLTIAAAQALQDRLPNAIATLEDALRRSSDTATEFEIRMRLSTLYVRSAKNWKSAELHLIAAKKIAPDKYSQWRVSCELARVPYYLLQYKQAIKAFEELLQTYPNSQTAEFARPYLWYLKNCTEKKI